MFLSRKLIIFFIILFLPLQSHALFGLAGRAEQKQKISAARKAYKEGDYQESINICRDFLIQNQDAPKRRARRIYVILGDAYAALGDYDHALLTYNEALEVLPKDISLNLALANLYYKTELYDKAIEFYNKVLKLDEDNPNALLGLGRAYLQTGFLSKSRQYFQDYLSEEDQAESSAYYDYAVANFLSNNNDIAMEYALKAEKADKNNPDIYFLIAKIYNALNDEKQAEENINKALMLDGNRQDIFLTSLLWKAYKPQNASEVLNEIKAYQKQNPSSQLAICIEGTALLTEGEKQKAITVFKKIQKQNEESFIKEVATKIVNN